MISQASAQRLLRSVQMDHVSENRSLLKPSRHAWRRGVGH